MRTAPHADDAVDLHLDITRLHDDTGFQPASDVERATADYFARLRDAREPTT